MIGADSPPVGLGFCVQVVRAQVDFHPSNVIGLPPELGSRLKEQQLALELKICGGIRCPDRDVLDKIPVAHRAAGRPPRGPVQREVPPLVPVPGKMLCFCLDVFATAHVAREFINGEERLVGKVDGVEIVDVKPDGLEANMECYIRTAVTLFLRQKLAIPLLTFFVDFPLFGLGTISLVPTPNPPVPHNPAVEDDQLKAFVTMIRAVGGDDEPSDLSRLRMRIRTAVQSRRATASSFAKSDSAQFWLVFRQLFRSTLHLEKGSIHLNDDGTVEIDALDVVWDTLTLKVCFDFPGFTIPGLLRNPRSVERLPRRHPRHPYWRAGLYPAEPLGARERDLQSPRAPQSELLRRSGPSARLDRLRRNSPANPTSGRFSSTPDFVSVDPIDVPASDRQPVREPC